jgi:class 3 adenylate cyclase
VTSCPTCGANAANEARFCAECGSPLSAGTPPATSCTKCGARLEADARFCPSCGFASDTPAQERLEERKLVTVLFADVTGSTELGEQLDPERLRAVLQRYFAAMSAAIAAWNGTVEKYIGDAVMAVFGVPVAREDDAERALHAATEMLDRLKTLNAELQERYGVAVRIRIGVNTGEVVAPLNAARGGQMLVSGDAVNVAARLQAAGEPGEVLAGERTYLAARHAFVFDEPVELDLKGKSRPVAARRLRGVLDTPARGLPGLSAPMIGRDRELETLTSLLD